MLTGIGFLAVITASVTASLIEISRRRFAESEGELARQSAGGQRTAGHYRGVARSVDAVGVV